MNDRFMIENGFLQRPSAGDGGVVPTYMSPAMQDLCHDFIIACNLAEASLGALRPAVGVRAMQLLMSPSHRFANSESPIVRMEGYRGLFGEVYSAVARHLGLKQKAIEEPNPFLERILAETRVPKKYVLTQIEVQRDHIDMRLRMWDSNVQRSVESEISQPTVRDFLDKSMSVFEPPLKRTVLNLAADLSHMLGKLDEGMKARGWEIWNENRPWWDWAAGGVFAPRDSIENHY